MLHNLENVVTRNARNPFKSEGEKRVAATLEKYGIRYEYDRPVWVDDGSKVRRLRPDFYLPDFNLFIEYYGRVGNQDYDIRTANKKAAYAANNLHVISLYPWNLIQDWPNYLFDRLPIPPNHRPLMSPSKRYAPVQSKPRYSVQNPSISRYHPSPRSSYR